MFVNFEILDLNNKIINLKEVHIVTTKVNCIIHTVY